MVQFKILIIYVHHINSHIQIIRVSIGSDFLWTFCGLFVDFLSTFCQFLCRVWQGICIPMMNKSLITIWPCGLDLTSRLPFPMPFLFPSVSQCGWFWQSLIRQLIGILLSDVRALFISIQLLQLQLHHYNEFITVSCWVPCEVCWEKQHRNLY